ncbi:hypothetical protein [Nocardia sp. NPDC052112]|uniref:hypothetical protein n=1 Tax=Nocardia sp. NPDC052112 TaxID=3155646 RepID=UPI003438B98D
MPGTDPTREWQRCDLFGDGVVIEIPVDGSSHVPTADEQAAWPAYGIAEQRVELDSDSVQRAAEHAEVLWPTDAEPRSREVPRVVPDFAAGGWFERAVN